VDLRAGLDDLEKRKFFTLPGFEPTIPVFEREKTLEEPEDSEFESLLVLLKPDDEAEEHYELVL
jgi:hypothetical protein